MNLEGTSSELIVTLVRLAFLVGLWLLVLGSIAVLRRDIAGTRVLARGSIHPRRPREREPRRDKPGRGAPRRLQVTGGPLNGTTLRLGEGIITIGRAPGSTLVLDDDYSSNRHARIFPDGGTWYVEDLGSTNGTYLSGTPVTAPTPVPVGAQIRIGQTVIELLR